MNDKELLHHLECLHYKIKYRIFIVDEEYEFMAKILKNVITKMKGEIK